MNAQSPHHALHNAKPSLQEWCYTTSTHEGGRAKRSNERCVNYPECFKNVPTPSNTMPQAAGDDQHGNTERGDQCDEGHAPSPGAVADRQMRGDGVGQRGADVPCITCERGEWNERSRRASQIIRYSGWLAELLSWWQREGKGNVTEDTGVGALTGHNGRNSHL